ncbi:phospho-N-acetylmuramoyl-pentapeptide-transferase [Candidatus Berkelbacteria bacterium]|nr:phospho-N-acetylmuramoyl-pentapeptide-transferase [Candidatus Berkelbacteria bacterium]
METILLSLNDLSFVFWLTAMSFVVAILLTPLLTDYLYSHKVWKRPRDTAITGERTPVFTKLHAAKHKRHIPTMAGVLIWGVVAIMTLLFNLDRAGTWLPLGIMVAAGLLGLADDYVNITWSDRNGIKGLRTSVKFGAQLLIAGVGAWWFFTKLGFDILHVPGVGDFSLGLWYVPLFMLVIIAAANAVNITDGLDGLAGGLLAIVFTAYAVIALTQGNIPLAGFCGSMVGAVLAYTWFNIYPARFIMGDTGSLATGATLGVVAMLTNTALPLILIAGVFVIETLSSILQIASKRLVGRKIFNSAPLHHHLESLGWPETMVTMRLWVIGGMFAIVGLVVALFGQGQ